jgi:hypothetical protein
VLEEGVVGGRLRIFLSLFALLTFAAALAYAVLEWESLDPVTRFLTPLAAVGLILLAYGALAPRLTQTPPLLVAVNPAPAAPRPSFASEVGLGCAAAVALSLALWYLIPAFSGLNPSLLLADPSLLLTSLAAFLALAGLPLTVLAWALFSAARRWRRYALARELARQLRFAGSAIVLPEEVEHEVGAVWLREFYGRFMYWRRVVEGGFQPLARARGNAVAVPSVPLFIAARRASGSFFFYGSEGFLRAPAVKLLAGRYRGLYILLLEPGYAERSFAVDGAFTKYWSAPGGALFELEWNGNGGRAAGAALRVGVHSRFYLREYVKVVELRLRKPGATRFAVAWRGSKLVALPELRVSSVCRALGAREILAGDPAGAPAELEVTVYGLASKKSSVIPLGL